jgi:hypothetical protein
MKNYLECIQIWPQILRSIADPISNPVAFIKLSEKIEDPVFWIKMSLQIKEPRKIRFSISV